jgi:tripartite-type tricarboxylate transporter receptor subunit TctC
MRRGRSYSRGMGEITMRSVIRKRFVALTLLGTLAALPNNQAAAQDYPTRPITMIVPYPAGGGVDAMGRIIGEKLSVAPS